MTCQCQSRTQKRDFREARSSEWKHEKRVKLDDGSWVLTHDFTNEFFEEYYKAQGIVPEEEWEEFLATLGSNLPTTFRINAGTKFAADLLRKLETDLFSHFHDEPIEARSPHPICPFLSQQAGKRRPSVPPVSAHPPPFASQFAPLFCFPRSQHLQLSCTPRPPLRPLTAAVC